MVWHSLEDPYIPALLKTIATFQVEYPNVQFDVLYVPQLDLRASFEQAALEGGGPSVLIGSAEWGPSLYERGLIAGLSDLANPDLLKTLNPAALGASRYQDELIGLPLNIDGVVLFRNQAIIPQQPFTFDELVSLANSASKGDTLGAYLDLSFFFSGAHLTGLGGELMTPDGEPAFNDERGREWVNLLLSFDQAGPTDFFTDNDFIAFKEGRVGFIIDGTWRRNELVEAIGETNLAIDPWPIHADGHLSGFIQADNIYLCPRALDEDHLVSWKFTEFFMSPDSQSELAEVGLIPAASGSPVNIAAGKINITDPLIQQAMIALVEGTNYPLLPEMSIYSMHLDIALKSVFEDGTPPSEALKTASEAIKEAVLSLHATPTPSS